MSFLIVEPVLGPPPVTTQSPLTRGGPPLTGPPPSTHSQGTSDWSELRHLEERVPGGSWACAQTRSSTSSSPPTRPPCSHPRWVDTLDARSAPTHQGRVWLQRRPANFLSPGPRQAEQPESRHTTVPLLRVHPTGLSLTQSLVKLRARAEGVRPDPIPTRATEGAPALPPEARARPDHPSPTLPGPLPGTRAGPPALAVLCRRVSPARPSAQTSQTLQPPAPRHLPAPRTGPHPEPPSVPTTAGRKGCRPPPAPTRPRAGKGLGSPSRRPLCSSAPPRAPRPRPHPCSAAPHPTSSAAGSGVAQAGSPPRSADAAARQARAYPPPARCCAPRAAEPPPGRGRARSSTRPPRRCAPGPRAPPPPEAPPRAPRAPPPAGTGPAPVATATALRSSGAPDPRHWEPSSPGPRAGPGSLPSTAAHPQPRNRPEGASVPLRPEILLRPRPPPG